MAESTREITAKHPRATRAGTGDAAAAPKKQTAKPEPTTEIVTGAPEAAAKPRFGFFRALGGRKTTAITPAGTAKDGRTRPVRQQSSMGRFFFGMSLYLILALAAQFILTFIYARVPGQGQQVLFTLPLLGAVTTYIFTWMIVLVVILYALYKFKVLPRSLGQPREKLATVKADPKNVKAAPAKVAREPVEGPNDEAYARVKARIRADRRKGRRG